MKEYIEPILSVEIFDIADVIVTSGDDSSSQASSSQGNGEGYGGMDTNSEYTGESRPENEPVNANQTGDTGLTSSHPYDDWGD